MNPAPPSGGLLVQGRLTPDPFDRLIAAHAIADDARLLTANRTLREHVRAAFWED